ncbi:putative RING-H2 finger protein ATL21A [Benincasa hispida]|uniref:putative RING-H2 finger protein ATL21A n=1 Tax=Benincasa hispida TaxID=102211 RepID=UPI0019011142|nr:putative RING-H2 finger protein ATL21A [Benincasa hispida]
MEISIFSIFFFFFFLISPISIKAQFPSSKTHCNHGCPKIQFPFDFNISCSSNTTRIHFKTYDSLSIKSISYDQKRLDLVDLNRCVHAAFLKLNLDLTPFRYFYVVKDYWYLNCTTRLVSTSSTPIPCLSRDGEYYVYAVRPPLMGSTPRSCKEIKRVKIPFEYSPYLDDGSFGLSLTWGFDDHTKTKSQIRCFFKATNFQVVGISLLVAMVAILSMVMMKIYHSKNKKYSKEEAEKKMFEHSYEPLKTGSDEPLV